MKCDKCGATFRDGSKYCANCGAGTINLIDSSGSADNQVSCNSEIKKIIPLLIAAGVVIIAAAAVLIFFMLPGSITPNASIKKDWTSRTEVNASGMIACVPKDYIEEILDNYDLTKSELKDAIEEYLGDQEYTDDDGKYFDAEDIDKIEFKFKKNKTLSKRKVRTLKSNMKDSFDFKHGDFEPGKIKAAEEVYASIYLYDDDGDRLTKRSLDSYTVFKYKGKWYSYSALSAINRIAANY